jgi:hypothetical protein
VTIIGRIFLGVLLLGVVEVYLLFVMDEPARAGPRGRPPT